MMELAALLEHIRSLPEYKKLQDNLREGNPPSHPLHLSRAVRPAIAAALSCDLRRPVLLLLPKADRMLTLEEELPAWAPELEVLSFPDPNPMPYECAPWSPRTLRRRVTALARLTTGRQPGGRDATEGTATLILASARAAMTRTIAPRTFIANARWLKSGSTFRFNRLIDLLVNNGYTHSSLVAEPGQFSRRGGILDLWPPAEEAPVRVEFFGDEIDSLRRFNPASQRSIETLTQVRITPAREGIPRLFKAAWEDILPPGNPLQGPLRDPYLEFTLPLMNPAPSGLLDFLPEEAIVLFDDRAIFEDAVSEVEEHALSLRRDQVEAGALPDSFPLSYLTLAELNDTLSQGLTLDLGSLSSALEDEITLSEAFQPGPRFGGKLRPLMDHLTGRLFEHHTLVIVSRQASRLSELWAESDTPRPVQERLPAQLEPGDLHFVQGALTEGWILDAPDGAQIHLLTDAEIFGWSRPKPRVRVHRVAAAPESAYADLKSGDWVVHVDYGIGRFQGLVERVLDGLQREFLLVEYDAGAQLYVPIHQADRLTRYIGADARPPTLSRLGTQTWERAKSKVHEAVIEVARELLELYAQRQSIQGHAFSPDTTWQGELEASFPYIETEDQLKSLQAVKRDMERVRPMDRLICGDVGYGKTEVALRAAFKAVMDNKQVAMLVPTTVLAQQHFNTFRQRLAPFPVEVEMLSRFRSRRETSEILRRLAAGEVDIVIGTHRLLQHDVTFKDLGLLVIDEEQRFGVTHKEFLKQMRTEVDVLTMTATPIPRTLYMALTGARDISTINTPPEERLPIITHVGKYDPRLVRQAVLREIDRGGQVFFVHNRVQTIETVRHQLERLVPEAHITVGHGQLEERKLASVMERFTGGEIDVLVSTSIIESGLDIPNANTLIVDRADMFGLAQLYQLRGRVGRGASQGYAYFFRHTQQRTTEEALERLEIISANPQLGAGYNIAMRDLEMRGAGDILGTRQHGHIAAIGFHLYTRLLTTAVRHLKETITPHAPLDALPFAVEPLPAAIDLPLPSAIPADYFPDRDLRLQLYRRMAEVRTMEGIEALTKELADRFGPPPPELENLLYQLRVRILAAFAGIDAISTENGQILLQLPLEDQERHLPHLGHDVRRSKRGLWLTRSEDRDWTERLVEVLVTLREFRQARSS